MVYDKDIICQGINDRKIKYLVTEKATSDLQAIARQRKLDQTLQPWELAVAIANHDEQMRYIIKEESQVEIIPGLYKGRIGTVLEISSDKKSFLIEISENNSYWFYYYEITFVFGVTEERKEYDWLKELDLTKPDLRKQIKETFMGVFLRDIAIELGRKDQSLKYSKTLYIDLICVHFDTMADLYIYLAQRDLGDNNNG